MSYFKLCYCFRLTTLWFHAITLNLKEPSGFRTIVVSTESRLCSYPATLGHALPLARTHLHPATKTGFIVDAATLVSCRRVFRPSMVVHCLLPHMSCPGRRPHALCRSFFARSLSWSFDDVCLCLIFLFMLTCDLNTRSSQRV